MTLDEAQKQEVAKWIEEGLKLSEIQSKLGSQFGLRMTYMEVRLLVDDLKLTPKDQQRSSSAKQILAKDNLAESAQSPAPEELEGPLPDTEKAVPGTGSVTVTVDRVARPGAVVSGSVTFTDGNTAAWHLDQLGRLGLAAQQQGYRPSQQDLEVFQVELQRELQKMGY
jgi:hypothetical protein